MTHFDKDSDREHLERLLTTLSEAEAQDVDLVPAVLEQIRRSDADAPAHHRRGRRRRMTAIVAVSALGLAACAAIPPIRDAVVELFSVNGIRVRQGPPSATRPPGPTVSSPSPSPSPSVADVYAGLGERTTVAEAEAYSHGRLLLPAALGRPDAVFRRGALVTLGYGGEHPRWLVMEVVEPSSVLLEKIVLTGANVRKLTVNGNPGVWVEGPQELIYVGPDREPRVEDARLSANTLIWEQDAVSVRIETPQGLAAALRVASSMR
jgi:hypothetical protein